MKRVIAIIRPFKLDDVREALLDLGISGITVVDVRGIGRQHGHIELYRGSEYVSDFVAKTRLEIVIPDHLLDECVQTIMREARTGRLGDGKVFVTEVIRAWRIRTGEEDEDAL